MEDITLWPGAEAGSQNITDPPLKQGLELFQKALDVWLPCFNQSKGRTAATDPGNPTGSGNSTNSTNPGDKSGASPTLCAASGVWAVVGVFSYIFYHAL